MRVVRAFKFGREWERIYRLRPIVNFLRIFGLVSHSVLWRLMSQSRCHLVVSEEEDRLLITQRGQFIQDGG